MGKETPEKTRFERLSEIRDRLSELRHEITMLRLEDKLFADWILPCEGALTCVIVTSYDAIEEMKKHHEKWGS